MRKLSIVLTVLLSVLLAFVACDNSIDIGLDTKVEVKEIVLNETELKILTGDEKTLVATVLPEDATDKSVTWSSSDEDVATVDANGKVTGVGAGEATITVTSNSDKTVTETCSVKVAVNPKLIPLTLEFINAGDFWINYDSYYDLSPVKYSLNGQAKGELEDEQHVEVSAGDIICFFRDVAGARGDAYPVNINCNSQCYVYGNVMSLIDSDDFATADEVYATFRGLFSGNEHISNHPTIDIILPATTLAEGCYSGMFYGCKGLTRAPELPATQLAVGCYDSMFSGCTSLTTAPELTADVLASYCYCSMFRDCTSLTTAPELPAKTLADNCYDRMFYDCTSLKTAPELPADELANNCYDRMFYGCTSLETAPELPATTLKYRCYFKMFLGCTSLNYITCYATDIAADDCTENWVLDVELSGIFYCPESMNDSWTAKGSVSGKPANFVFSAI